MSIFGNAIVDTISTVKERSQLSGSADCLYGLGEVRNVKAYVAGLEVPPTGRCSLLKGLRIRSQSSSHLELAAKELCRSTACFQER